MALRLEPDTAAVSIKRRLEIIDQCTGYVRSVVSRYEGLHSFEDELNKHGIGGRVAEIMAGAPQPAPDAPKQPDDGETED